jgi:hypothetical protein
VEQLRIFPLALFFVGGLLLYAGITDRTASQIVREVLLNNSPGIQQDLYAEDRPPMYAGIMTYRRPTQYSDQFFFG